MIYDCLRNVHMMLSNENVEVYSKHSKKYDFDCMKFTLYLKQMRKCSSLNSINSKLICLMFSLRNELLEFDYLTSKLNTLKKKKHTTIDKLFKRSIIDEKVKQQANKLDVDD